MQPQTTSFPSIGAVLGNPTSFLSNNGELSEGGFEISRVFFLVPFLLFQGGVGGLGVVGEGAAAGIGMDLSKVGEKILSSVRSARSLGLLPPADDRPEVPARAAAAAAVARVLAGLPPHQRFNLPSSSEEPRSIYGTGLHGQVVEELEEKFYEEDFDPIKHILEHIPAEENELDYFEKQATLRLAQLDVVSERLSHQVMEHHEVMVKGMNLVRELEKDLKIANIICMNGRRHLTSSMNEVSRDLIVNSHSKRKQALLDVLPVLTELCHALDMQGALESLVEEGNYCEAFQVLSEYLQLLDSLSELSAVQQMSHDVEVWLGKTLQRLDSLLLGVCQDFKEENYLTVVDAYALIGDVSGLAEKIQSFFMQEVLSETHSVLKNTLLGDQEAQIQNSRLTYSDLCLQIPESKFRLCLLRTLAILFRLMCSYHEIMSFQLEAKDSTYQSLHTKHRETNNPAHAGVVQKIDSVALLSNDSEEVGSCSINSPVSNSSPAQVSRTGVSLIDPTTATSSLYLDSHHQVNESQNDGTGASISGSPQDQLRKEATTFVSQTLQRGRKNLWQLTTSRVSVLLSSAVVGSTSIHQFLKNYEDLNAFILAGEAFCGSEAVEFRNKLKVVCENYFASLHRQHIHALKMVLEKETWIHLPLDTVQVVSFPGLVGDGAPLIAPSNMNSTNVGFHHPNKLLNLVDSIAKNSGFTSWLKSGNPFLPKLMHVPKEGHMNGAISGEYDGEVADGRSCDQVSPNNSDVNHMNGPVASEDENEDLLADFIDEDSQLPSRSSQPSVSKSSSSHWKNQETTAQTGSSLCLLRSMDKYARLMQKLEIINVEFFKGICQLFEVFFYFVYETFVHSSGNGSSDSLNYRLKAALSRITQDCEQWVKPQMTPLSSSSPTSLSTYMHADVTPTSPPLVTSSGLKERCAGADTISCVAQILKRSKSHLQSMLLQKNPAVVEDFYAHLVDSVPDLAAQIHRTTARLLLQINGFVDKIANAKWEVKELGMEHNGYVDLLLGEFKHYKSRLASGGIQKEIQDLLLESGVEIIAETLIEGLSRVKRCTDEGRALMSLDMQVLINGLKHFVSVDVKPKFQIVETFIKAYYLPETEYVHWSRAHPEYSKNQIVGLINLVATMKGWKRKTRLEILEKLE